jgi:TRAP-type C4-dicarboxylate transport system permease small subunit
MSVFRLLAKQLENVLAALSAVSFLAIMGVMVVDVMLRYLVSSPLGWSFDLLTRYLILIAFFFAVSYTWRHGEHLYVEILYRKLPTRPRSAVLFVFHLAVTVIFGIAFWLAARTTYQSWTACERLVGDMPWPVWTSHAIVAIGLGMLTIRAIERTLSLLFIAVGAEEEAEHPIHCGDEL